MGIVAGWNISSVSNKKKGLEMDELEQQQFEEMQEFNIREMEMEYDMSVDKVLDEREITHGSFSTNSIISQGLKAHARMGRSWETLSTEEREAIEMILHKVARAVNGSYNKDDYVDIAGYATLVTRNRNEHN